MPPAGGLVALGGWLRARRRALDAGEAGWLEGLARFDREGGWAVDGALSTVAWLVGRVGMARSSAYEKVQLARQLACRPVLAAALREGRISYSQLRVIARAAGATEATDEALVVLAEAGSLRDLEVAVGRYLSYREQDLLPGERKARRGLRVTPRGDGTSRVEATLSDLEASELVARCRRQVAKLTGDGDPGPAGVPERDPGRSGVGDGAGLSDSAAADSGENSQNGHRDAKDWADGPGPDVPYGELLADGLMDLVRSVDPTLAVPASDRYLVHVVLREGESTLVDGTVLADPDAGCVGCDASRVLHSVDGDGGWLRLGRRQRAWSVSQRRAVTIRDRGCCRFPGCGHRLVDIHHIISWEQGGPTDIENATLLCRRHHRLVHAGWRITGDPGTTLHFHQPPTRW